MRQLVKRPIAFAGAAFYVTSFLLVFASQYVRLATLYASFALVAVAFAASLFFKNHRGILAAISLIFAVIMLASGTSYYAYDVKPETYSVADGETHLITAEAGEIFSASAYGGSQSLKILTVDGESVSCRAVITTDGTTYREGTHLAFSGIFTKITDEYDSADARSYMSDGILFSLTATDTPRETDGTPSISSIALTVSSRLNGIFCSSLGYKNGGFASALLLGNKSMLEYGVRNDFTRLGIAHLLAISGLHLTVVALCLSKLVEKLTRSEKLGAVTTVVVSVAYSFLVGLTMSVVRATVMLTVTSVGKLVSRRSDTLTSLAIAVSLIVLVNPYSAGSVSLLLSATSVVGLSVYGRLGDKRKRKNVVRRTLDKVLLSVTVFATALPVSWLFFDTVSFVSPVANLIFIPLVSLILLVLPILLIVSPVPWLLTAVARPIGMLVSLCLSLAESLAETKGITLSTSLSSFAVVSAVIVVALATSAFLEAKARRWCYGAVTLAVVLLFVSVIGFRISRADVTDVIFTAHGNNDAAVVVSENETLLIDVSDGSYAAISPAIRAMTEDGYADLDALMLTHYHQRHIKTVRKIIRRYSITTLYLPNPLDGSERDVYESLAEIAVESNCAVVIYDRSENETVAFADAVIEIGRYTKLKRSTHPVIAFAVTSDCSVCYLGGATNESEADGIISLDDRRYIAYGTHSPIYKKAPALADCGILVNIRLIDDGVVTDLPTDAVVYSEDSCAIVRIGG